MTVEKILKNDDDDDDDNVDILYTCTAILWSISFVTNFFQIL